MFGLGEPANDERPFGERRGHGRKPAGGGDERGHFQRERLLERDGETRLAVFVPVRERALIVDVVVEQRARGPLEQRAPDLVRVGPREHRPERDAGPEPPGERDLARLFFDLQRPPRRETEHVDDGKIVRSELPERRAARPPRRAEPLRSDANQIADRAARDEPRGLDQRGVEPQQVANHADGAGACLGRQERRRALDTERERLLDEHGQAAVERAHRAGHVVLGWRGDDDGVDGGEHGFVELGHDPDLGRSGRERRAVEPGIDDAGQPRVRGRSHDAGEVLAPAPGADERHSGLAGGHVL